MPLGKHISRTRAIGAIPAVVAPVPCERSRGAPAVRQGDLLRGQQRFQWLRQFLFIKRLSRAGARGKAEPQATLHPLLQRGEKPSRRVYWSSHSPCYLRLYNSDSDMQPCITGSEMHLKFVTTNIPVLRESFQHSCLFSALKQERTQTAATPRRTRP